MRITAAKCPSCGANIQVDQDGDKTKCDFCGTSIFVEDAIAKYKVELSGEVTINNLPKIESLMKVANNSYNSGDYKDAYEKYDKVLELDPENHEALFKKCTSKYNMSINAYYDFYTYTKGLSSFINLIKNDKKELDNYLSQIVAIINGSARHLDSLMNGNRVLWQFAEMVHNKLYSMIQYEEFLYGNVTNPALKKRVASSIVELCDITAKKRQIGTKGILPDFFSYTFTGANLKPIKDKYINAN